MQQVLSSVPKRTPPLGAAQVTFQSAKQHIAAHFHLYASKLALVSDKTHFSLFAGFALSPRAISLVLEGDALPLFSLPEGVCCILAAGGRETLLAARCFAELRRIPCAVYPTDALLSGAAEQTAFVPFGEELAARPLAPADICLDESLLSLGEGWAALQLARLSHFESRALSAFGMGEVRPETELPERTFRPVFSALCALPEEVKAGEGFVLASLLQKDGVPSPNALAYFQLLSLYAAFFLKGKPRKAYIPDYALRLQRAGSPLTSYVPTPEEYAARALTLERIRGPFASEAQRLLGELQPRPAPASGGTSRLKYLPEYAPCGLSAVLRDFGLMEW